MENKNANHEKIDLQLNLLIELLDQSEKQYKENVKQTTHSHSFAQISYNRKTGMRGISEHQLITLASEARSLFINEPVLVRINAPLIIVGDLHGQFDNLLQYFAQCGRPPEKKFLFLGDYVDRGKHSLETISLLFAYKLKYPDLVTLLRGNHECSRINSNGHFNEANGGPMLRIKPMPTEVGVRIYGFYDECKRRYSTKLWKVFTDCFNCLPIASVVESTMFCVHGGLSPDLKKLAQLDCIRRPTEIPDMGIICDLLWSDPDNDFNGWKANERGVSYTFGEDAVYSFLENCNINLIVRAHQVVEDGYEFFADKKVVTIFSAANYCGEFDNAGAVMQVSDDLVCSFIILKPCLTKKVVDNDGKTKDKIVVKK